MRMAYLWGTSTDFNLSKWASTKKNIHVDMRDHSFSMPAERRYLDGCIELNHHPSYSKKKRGHKRI